MACLWAHSACTASKHNPKSSLIAIHMTIDKGYVETVQWVTQHMHTYLPAPMALDTDPTLTPTHKHDYAHELAQMGQQSL